MKAINRIPEIGEIVFYRNVKGESIRHTRVEPPKPTSDGIIYIEDEKCHVDSIIAIFANGEYNTRLSFSPW